MGKNNLKLLMLLILTISLANISYSADVDTSGLVSYLQMDTANISGSLIIDVSGTAKGQFNGTMTNTNNSAGIINQARGFPNSANQKITITGLDETEFSNQFTVSTWLQKTAVAPATRRAIFEQDGGGSHTVALNILFNNTILCRIGGTAGFSDVYSNVTMQNNTLTHIVCRWTQNGVHEIFINGKPAGLKTAQNAVFPTIPDFIIGEYSGGGLFKLQGILDELGFWDIALNNQNITNLYNNGSGCPHPFNNCAGSPPPETDPPVVNQSTLNVTNALINGTIWRTSKDFDVIVALNTPTVTFTTNENANCSIGISDLNYTAMTSADANTECGTNPTTSHTCTLPSTQALSQGNQNLYLSCQDALGNENVTSSSGALNITALLPDLFTSLARVSPVFEATSEVFNFTLEFRNLSQVTSVNTTLNYNSNYLYANNALNGTNTTFFNASANVPLRATNNTNLDFNFSYTIRWLNGSTLNGFANSTQLILWAYNIQNVTFGTPILATSPSTATINITNSSSNAMIIVRLESEGANNTATFQFRNSSIDQYTGVITPTGLIPNATIYRQIRTFLQLTYNGSTLIRKINQTQAVNQLSISSCDPVNNTIAMTFNITDELDGNKTGVTVEGQIKAYTNNSNLSRTFNYQVTGLNSTFHICINPSYAVYNATIDFQLRRPNFNTREFHDYRILTNVTQLQPFFMSNEASNITIKVSDVNDIIRVNEVIQAYKVNLTTGLTTFVDSGRTDVAGKVTLSLISNDNFEYKFIVKDSLIPKILFNSTQQKVTPNQEIFLRLLLDQFTTLPKILAFRSFERSLSYNTSNGLILLTYNDLGAISNRVCLQVYQSNSSGLTNLSVTCSTSQSDTLSYNTTGLSGVLQAKAYAFGSPISFVLSVLEIDLDAPTQKILMAEGLFAGLFTLVTVTLTAVIFSPAGAVMVGGSSIALMSILGFLPFGYPAILVLMILTIMIAVVLRN